MKSFSGKTALVTGASSGIGKAFAESLAKRGARLILVARSKDRLDTIAASLTAGGTKVDVIAMDLSVPAAAARLQAETMRLGLEVDLLVNNAGFGKWGKFLDFDAATYSEMMHLNMDAVVELCHVYLPAMTRRGDCAILNVGSTGSFVSLPWTAVYAATKAFVLSFSEALSYELRGRGVTVTALCPGNTESNFATTANASVVKGAGESDSAEMVANFGLDAVLAGQMTVIPGASNRLVAFLPRILSRARIVRIAGESWKKRLIERGMKL